MRKHLLFIAGLASVAILPAFAQSSSQGDEDELKAGTVSSETPTFNKLDTDDNDYVSLEEMTAAGPSVAEHFNRLDDNSDQRLTEEEYNQIIGLPGSGVPSGGAKVD